MEPEFIGLDVVLALHTESLRLFGGTDGLRDPGLLDSALAAAQNAHFKRRTKNEIARLLREMFGNCTD